MLGMVNLLSKTALDPMQLDYVRTAELSGRSLFYLINDVLGTIHHHKHSRSVAPIVIIDDVLKRC